jgi:hypothetical protein
VVGAAALVVVGVPWLVTRLLRPAAAELQAVRGAVTEPQRRASSMSSSIVEAAPALLPGREVAQGAAPPRGVAEPAPGGVAASSGPILESEREPLAPSPPSTNLTVAPLPAAPLPVAPLPAAPQVRVLILPEEGAPQVAPVAELPPSTAAAPAASAAVAQAPAEQTLPGQTLPGQTSPGQSAAPSAPRGANPWDFRDLEFE